VAKVTEEIDSVLQTFFKRSEVLPPSEWVQKHIRLNHRQSIHKGLYSLKRTPYFRKIYDDCIDPNIRQVAIQKSAQIGYSQFLSNLCFYFVCNRTNPIGIIFPSQALSQQWAERCLHNGLDSCEPLKEYLTGRLDDIRRTDFTFTSCNLKVIGGGSANKLSSNNICYLFLDEIDKYQEFTKESNVIELAIDRTITYQETKDAKIVLGSTPTLCGASEIEKHYREGSQGKYHVPCPHCRARQELVFEQVKFPDCKTGDDYDLNKVERTAYYECSACHKKIEESDKARILNLGEWVETNPKAPTDCKSYHISALYSLSLSWGYIARQFLISKNDRARLQNFFNSFLGLPWQPHISTVTETTLDKLVEGSPKYNKGELLEKPKALLMSVDVQQTIFYYMVLAVFESGKQAILDYGSVVAFEDLSYLAQRQYKLKDSDETFGIYGAFIDAGYRTSDVYRYCRNSGMFFVPVFGRTKEQKMFTPIRRNDILFENQYLTIIHINDTMFSNNILLNSLRVGGNDSLWLPQDTDNILKSHLTAVTIIEKKDAKGYMQRELVSKRENHHFDTLKLNLALYYMLKPELDAEKDKPEPDAKPEPVEDQQVYSGW